MNRTEIGIAIGTAILSFFGALAGVFVASKLDQSNWQERYEADQKKTLLDRRVAVLEKMVTLKNKAPTVVGLRASLQSEKDLIAINIACTKANIKARDVKQKCKSDRPFDPARIESIGKEIHALNAEYASNLMLASLYFGDQTRMAVRLIGEDPWQAKPASEKKLFDAMLKELNAFPID